MADETHLAMLKQGAGAWNAWRSERAGARADLSRAGLRGLDLMAANLSGADLRNADLRGTILVEANLVDADLAGANFFKAVLDGADLFGARLIGARFLNCAQLATTRNWRSAFRDSDLACGATLPGPPGSP